MSNEPELFNTLAKLNVQIERLKRDRDYWKNLAESKIRMLEKMKVEPGIKDKVYVSVRMEEYGMW